MNINPLFYAGFRIFIIIASIEILLVSVLLVLPGNMSTSEILSLNAIALAILSAPITCIYVIKPFLDDKQKMLAGIRNIATEDPLTQLANRHLVVEHLNRVVAGCTRHHEYCAVMLINLDNFKLINEQYGYEAGDAVLIEVARRLRAANRANDIVGRMGDDEFVILLERLQTDIGITGDRILQIANKFIAMINMPIKVKSTAVHVGASIGIRLLGFGPINTDTAIREADSAMYRAKEEGGNSSRIFDGKSESASNRSLNQYNNQKMSICS